MKVIFFGGGEAGECCMNFSDRTQPWRPGYVIGKYELARCVG